MLYNIVNSHNREVLSEGRNFQMGFAFLSKLKPNLFETVQPISPCKDYLNDVVWSEAVKRPVKAYGLQYSNQGIFGKNYAYLAVSICDFIEGGWQKFEEDTKNFANNYKKSQKFLNNIEKKLGIKQRTRIYPSNLSDVFFVKMPLIWTKYTYMVSAWSLLLRVSQWYDGKEDVKNYINNFNLPDDDTYNLNSAKYKIFKIMEENFLPVQNMEEMMGGTDVHNMGIVSFKF